MSMELERQYSARLTGSRGASASALTSNADGSAVVHAEPAGAIGEGAASGAASAPDHRALLAEEYSDKAAGGAEPHFSDCYIADWNLEKRRRFDELAIEMEWDPSSKDKAAHALAGAVVVVIADDSGSMRSAVRNSPVRPAPGKHLTSRWDGRRYHIRCCADNPQGAITGIITREFTRRQGGEGGTTEGWGGGGLKAGRAVGDDY
jgi:hypothetical protein